MCTDCGCNNNRPHTVYNDGENIIHTPHNDPLSVEVHSQLLSQNNQQASLNRALFEQHNITAINLMSSPGAGKTSLLERTIDELKGEYCIAVIEGDLETENDAARIRAKGVSAIQITTGNACHLDATMVNNALQQIDLEAVDLLFIENVGNLVCPASFDLGQHHNITLLSTPEGDDKPAKYPVIFRAAELMLITKCDLLPLLDDFNLQQATHYFRALSGNRPIIQLSSKNGSGIDAWCAWLKDACSHQWTSR